MLTFLQNLLSSEAFVPHGHCYLWKTQLVLLNVISDSLIGLAYYSIPLLLVHIVNKRKDLPFNSIFFLFGSFIVSCGTGHLIDIWTLWHPTYWLSGSVKALTATVSVFTALVLLSLVPQILAIPSNAQLEEANRKLEKEIIEHQHTENELQKLTQVLEKRVEIRTSELTEALQNLYEKNQHLTQALQELKNTQAQLIQSEKMSSLGQMIAGIAHEINNPINFIYANVSHAYEYITDLLDLIALYQKEYPIPCLPIQKKALEIDLDFLTEDLPKLVESMNVGTERIRKIVLSLRNFSRIDEAEMKSVDIHEGIENTLLILQHRLKAKNGSQKITVIKQYAKLPQVTCYPSQLNQVFMNLLTNAIDALEEVEKSKRRKILTQENSLSHNLESIDKAYSKPIIINPQIHIRTELADNDTVQILIADNGSGMTQEVQQKIFDPFFTTKPVGSGTGLGLSISYQIVVEKHKGSLKCYSTLGEGTEFVIKIPL
jgi:two-component system NtrC family sensor kinase